MVTSLQSSLGEAKVEGGFGSIAISHEEASRTPRKELVLIIFDDVRNGTEDVKVSVIEGFFVD